MVFHMSCRTLPLITSELDTDYDGGLVASYNALDQPANGGVKAAEISLATSSSSSDALKFTPPPAQVAVTVVDATEPTVAAFVAPAVKTIRKQQTAKACANYTNTLDFRKKQGAQKMDAASC